MVLGPRISGSLVALTLAVCSSSVASAQKRPTLPDVRLHDRSVLGDEPKMRFVTVTDAMHAEATKPSGIGFSVAPDASMRISRLQGLPFGEISLYRRAPLSGEDEVDPSRPWAIQVVANLEPRNLKGNVMIVVYDREDPTAIARHAFVAMWEATMTPFRYVGLRLLLDPESDGFHATHTYLLQIVQQWSQRERVLSQGTFRLE